MTRYRLPDGRTFSVNEPFYLASCDHCGWGGSTEKCGTDESDDVYCPNCYTSGADCGKVTETAVEIGP